MFDRVDIDASWLFGLPLGASGAFDQRRIDARLTLTAQALPLARRRCERHGWPVPQRDLAHAAIYRRLVSVRPCPMRARGHQPQAWATIHNQPLSR